MRTLVFVPDDQNDDGAGMEISQRLAIEPPQNFAPCTPVDFAEYALCDKRGWAELESVLRHYNEDFDCLVLGYKDVGDEKVKSLRTGMDILRRVAPELPVIVYVGTKDRKTDFNLLCAGVRDSVSASSVGETLLARVNMAVGTNGRNDREARIGPLRIDLCTGDVLFKNRHVYFTEHQTLFIRSLAQNQGRTVSTERLMGLIYERDVERPDPDILNVWLHRIRKTLNSLEPANYPNLGGIFERQNGRGLMLRTTMPPAEPKGGIKGQFIAHSGSMPAAASERPLGGKVVYFDDHKPAAPSVARPENRHLS